MATSFILESSPGKVKNIFLPDQKSVFITKSNPSVSIEHNLPFKVKFTSIKVPGYSSTNPPPIPLQVIGFSNYIL